MDIRHVEFITGAAGVEGMPVDPRPEVAFVGRSNVGKSSLINMVTGRRNIARTSGTPGKTTEINFFLVDDRFFLVDLPGFGYAKTSRTRREAWQKLIGRYLVGRPALRLVFQLIDSRHDPTKLDRELFQLMRESPAAHVVLLTKSDKLSGNQRQKSVARARRAAAEYGLELPVVLTSAEDGRGRDEILDWMELHLGL
jgi:GTP-binding protein